MIISPISDLDVVIRDTLAQLRAGIALSRTKNQQNPTTGMMVDLPEFIDFEIQVITSHQNLTRQTTDSEITNNVESSSEADQGAGQESGSGAAQETKLSQKVDANTSSGDGESTDHTARTGQRNNTENTTTFNSVTDSTTSARSGSGSSARNRSGSAATGSVRSSARNMTTASGESSSSNENSFTSQTKANQAQQSESDSSQRSGSESKGSSQTQTASSSGSNNANQSAANQSSSSNANSESGSESSGRAASGTESAFASGSKGETKSSNTSNSESKSVSESSTIGDNQYGKQQNARIYGALEEESGEYRSSGQLNLRGEIPPYQQVAKKCGPQVSVP